MSLLDDGTYWRERAEHIRTQAAALPESWSRWLMGQMVDDYDRLAERAEARHLLRRTPDPVEFRDD